MVDFTQLLHKAAGEAKRPKPLETGVYGGLVKNYEIGDNNKNRTPYIRLTLIPTEWPDTASSEIRSEVDLTKRQMRKDFFLTEDSLWRLDAFLRSCGIEPSGRTYEEVLPELVSQPVQFEVAQFKGQDDNISNNVNQIVGREGELGR
jgi:hypothetical protein